MTERWSYKRVEHYERLGYSATRIAQFIARPTGIAWGVRHYGDLRANRQPEVAKPEGSGSRPERAGQATPSHAAIHARDE